LNDQRRDRIRARSFPTKSERRARFLHRCRYFAESLVDQAESGDGEREMARLVLNRRDYQ
jgi:hypothetical protein